MQAVIGRKVGMTSIITQDGRLQGVTVIKVMPGVVSGLRTKERDGYTAAIISVGDNKRAKKPQQVEAEKAKLLPARVKREVRLDNLPETGAKVDVGQFKVGERVRVTAVSKGKGFAGTIKRHNFARGPMSHGSKNNRRPGSVGSMYPQKVFKGKKMAGRMGAEQVTVKNLEIVVIDEREQVMALKGAVPGPRKGLVLVRGVG